jgi:hypothetical protein
VCHVTPVAVVTDKYSLWVLHGSGCLFHCPPPDINANSSLRRQLFELKRFRVRIAVMETYS